MFCEPCFSLHQRFASQVFLQPAPPHRAPPEARAQAVQAHVAHPNTQEGAQKSDPRVQTSAGGQSSRQQRRAIFVYERREKDREGQRGLRIRNRMSGKHARLTSFRCFSFKMLQGGRSNTKLVGQFHSDAGT